LSGRDEIGSDTDVLLAFLWFASYWHSVGRSVVEWGLFWDWPTVGLKSKSGASGSSTSGIRDGLSFRLGRRKIAALTLDVWVSRSYICLLASKSAVACSDVLLLTRLRSRVSFDSIIIY